MAGAAWVRCAGAGAHTVFADGVAYMEFTDAVTRAWQSGEAVSLPL